jgi:hypothetical protein
VHNRHSNLYIYPARFLAVHEFVNRDETQKQTRHSLYIESHLELWASDRSGEGGGRRKRRRGSTVQCRNCRVAAFKWYAAGHQ